tara:strand:- start:607 stop:801 length:195 start_codon:yes stop_codon:yes gene_type:complete
MEKDLPHINLQNLCFTEIQNIYNCLKKNNNKMKNINCKDIYKKWKKCYDNNNINTTIEKNDYKD